MAYLELCGVKKRFASLEVIHGLDLEINEGEFIAIVGPSGCGKSTALRMICGLETMSEGDIRIGGVSVKNVTPSKRGVAMVFQSYALYPHMTVEENMGFSLRMEGLPRRQQHEKVLEAAKTLRLEALLQRKPKELSGGQRQRVAIGRAIVRKPKIFLFDEPLSNLDSELRVQMRVELARLHREIGSTMVYVTHDQVEALTLADRIVVMRGGKVEQFDRPMELYTNPANIFVAGFIGSPRMNFLDAVVDQVNGNTVAVSFEGLRGGSVAFEIEDQYLRAGAKITLGIRPEHLSSDKQENTFVEAKIDFVEQLGSMCYAHASAFPAGALIATMPAEGNQAVAGETRTLAFAARRCFLFDGEGKSLIVRK